MFVTDTVDAIYPPNEWTPQAIVDRLGDIMSRSRGRAAPTTPDPAVVEWAAARTQPRKPNLTLKRIETMSELEPFFTGISLMAYESIYHSAGKIDWEAVEAQLVADIFDGVDHPR
jgi:hypothetical protein